MQDITNLVSLISLQLMYDITFLSTICNNSSFSHKTGLTYIQHPYSPPRFKNLQLILIYLTTWPIFSVIQSNAVNVALTHVFIIFQ